VKVELALAQVTAIVQTILRVLPTGIFPPNILKYDAASVPILQLGLSSQTLTETDLFDLGQNFVRTQLATVQAPRFLYLTAVSLPKSWWISIPTNVRTNGSMLVCTAAPDRT
jgi:hypothetical protein